eukprot:comp11007_c0_seq1/m.5564 comp11007_c0_seq1/g.5564  ORF comp11007_c0_seq1/g.5564 comp11007_c0_seq1/m.5564 type:complete len:419 (-) comp11007_c0_seq1:79-1335(-)
METTTPPHGITVVPSGPMSTFDDFCAWYRNQVEKRLQGDGLFSKQTAANKIKREYSGQLAALNEGAREARAQYAAMEAKLAPDQRLASLEKQIQGKRTALKNMASALSTGMFRGQPLADEKRLEFAQRVEEGEQVIVQMSQSLDRLLQSREHQAVLAAEQALAEYKESIGLAALEASISELRRANNNSNDGPGFEDACLSWVVSNIHTLVTGIPIENIIILRNVILKVAVPTYATSEFDYLLCTRGEDNHVHVHTVLECKCGVDHVIDSSLKMARGIAFFGGSGDGDLANGVKPFTACDYIPAKKSVISIDSSGQPKFLDTSVLKFTRKSFADLLPIDTLFARGKVIYLTRPGTVTLPGTSITGTLLSRVVDDPYLDIYDDAAMEQVYSSVQRHMADRDLAVANFTTLHDGGFIRTVP